MIPCGAEWRARAEVFGGALSLYYTVPEYSGPGSHQNGDSIAECSIKISAIEKGGAWRVESKAAGFGNKLRWLARFGPRGLIITNVPFVGSPGANLCAG